MYAEELALETELADLEEYLDVELEIALNKELDAIEIDFFKTYEVKETSLPKPSANIIDLSIHVTPDLGKSWLDLI